MMKVDRMTRMERVLWWALMALYAPLMLIGPLLGMVGEAYIGVPDPAVQALSDVAYWLSASFILVIPATVVAAVTLRQKGSRAAAWCVMLVPMLVLAAVAGLDMAAGALCGM